jgi:hypothetical protein
MFIAPTLYSGHDPPQMPDGIIKRCCRTLCAGLEGNLQALAQALGVVKHKRQPGATGLAAQKHQSLRRKEEAC